MINISVVIPVYKGIEWIADCLNSLSAQTYPKESFEIVIVFNGPDDGSKGFVERFRTDNPHINISTHTSDRANASLARNIGAGQAMGSNITWIDVDDWVSPEYLQLLAMSSARHVVPFAQIVNVDSKGVLTPLNQINQDLFTKTTPIVSPTDFIRAMTFMTAKLLPKDWVLAVPLSDELRSGEDVAFYGELMAKYDFQLDLMPAAAGATYYRRITASSVSRGNSSRDFMVTQRADVIEHLSHSWNHASGQVKVSIAQMMRSQASFIRRFLSDNKALQTEVIDELVVRRIARFPWPVLQEPPTKLVIAYNFAPYDDTGAVVASKRIRTDGRTVDVISNNMSRVRGRHEDNKLLSAPYVAWMEEIQDPAYFASEVPVETFVTKGLEIYEKWKARGRKYQTIYSRSMWPASHFLAAAVKVKNPEIEWVAEFSDPARVTTTGEFRHFPLVSTSLKSHYLGQGPQLFSEILEFDAELFRWTEILPYLFADKLIFTNQNQFKIMIDYAPNELKTIIENKSIIKAQPTLPTAYYSIETNNLNLENTEYHIGYFGDFYNTRGLNEILSAMEMLSEQELKKLRLWIFSSNPPPLDTIVSKRVAEQISTYSKIKYFEFLNTLNKFDCLIVNDAITAQHHSINPYLPSKLSDYRGATSDIWAVVEPGSALAREQVNYKSNIGDVMEAAACIRAMLRSKFGVSPMATKC